MTYMYQLPASEHIWMEYSGTSLSGHLCQEDTSLLIKDTNIQSKISNFYSFWPV
jgi:hypothetical protein